MRMIRGRHAVSDEYVEALLEWKDPVGAQDAERWLAAHGLKVQRMVQGALLFGDGRSFERVFGIDLDEIEPPMALRVPAELAATVASITIPRPRQPHP